MSISNRGDISDLDILKSKSTPELKNNGSSNKLLYILIGISYLLITGSFVCIFVVKPSNTNKVLSEGDEQLGKLFEELNLAFNNL
jgi:hypothetical protein